LLAALALTRLPQPTDQAAEARRLLRAALEGLVQTSEFPAVSEAKALIETLA
jgi:hypothetical protein